MQAPSAVRAPPLPRGCLTPPHPNPTGWGPPRPGPHTRVADVTSVGGVGRVSQTTMTISVESKQLIETERRDRWSSSICDQDDPPVLITRDVASRGVAWRAGRIPQRSHGANMAQLGRGSRKQLRSDVLI